MDFRKIGFTPDAINYPLTDAGQQVIAMFNGVSVEQMPPEFGYSSNKSMNNWINALGERLTMGLPVKHETGRLLLPSELYIKG